MIFAANHTQTVKKLLRQTKVSTLNSGKAGKLRPNRTAAINANPLHNINHKVKQSEL